MKRLILLALMLTRATIAQQAPAQQHWLITFQLAPGLDLTKLTPEHMTAFTAHGKHLAGLMSKGLVVGGRTNETVGALAVLILACDEATARAAVSDDPAARAGYLKADVHPFALLMPPVPPAALLSDAKANYERVARYLLEAAAKMPDEGYAFRPSPDVRTFAQLVGHIAEAQYIACSLVRGEEYKPRGIEQNLSKKAELVAALEVAVGFCRESWSKLAPGAMTDRVTIFDLNRTKLGAMDIGTAHAFEHYGNMVTYLRMKGVVPPSSAK
jgi:uncharacterized damage-inducible protein DinB